MIDYKAALEKIECVGRLTPRERSHIDQLLDTTNEPLDLIISKLGLITEQELATLYSKLTNIDCLGPSYHNEITAIDAPLNRSFLSRNRLLPFRNGSNAVQLALVDPFDTQAIPAISFAVESEVIPKLTTHSHWEQLFAKLYPEQEHEEETITVDASADAAKLADLASTEPVIQLVNRLIIEASDQKASDIHLETGTRQTSIRYRIDGVLEPRNDLTSAQGLSVISRIKILAGLDIAERRRPQDGRFTYSVAGRAIDLRVSVIPTDYGESAGLRLLDKESVQLNFASLGFSPASEKTIRSLITKPHGIFLITGPTGSGKTTTLYTILKELSGGTKKILTIEDPIEYRLDGISQSQVNTKIDVTFASALRSFLRHDPDVMMVGEIRDLETATIAIQAALTGHLVFSTLHTNDAPSAITRLRDLGVEDYLIASTLLGVMGQRLVREMCRGCSGEGCASCHGTGFMGRISINESLSVSDEVGFAIRNGASEVDITKACARFVSMRDDGTDKAQQGLTTHAELTRVLGESS